jgi:hypothetical protein
VEGGTATEEEALRGGHLDGQGSAHGVLTLQGESRDVLTVLGGSEGRLDGGDSCNQRRES